MMVQRQVLIQSERTISNSMSKLPRVFRRAISHDVHRMRRHPGILHGSALKANGGSRIGSCKRHTNVNPDPDPDHAYN
jgi:hypothetical protein